MHRLARMVAAHRWWVLAGWLVLAIAGGVAAPHATSSLSYDFGLPGQPGYEANQRIVAQFGSGGDNAPILLVAGDRRHPAPDSAAAPIARAAARANPGARVVSWADQPGLRAHDGSTAVTLVYPRPGSPQEPYGRALPALRKVADRASDQAGVPVTVTGYDALSDQGGHGGASVLAETLFGGVGALVVLVIVFGSFLALMPVLIAAGSILATFLILWGLTQLTDIVFIVQYLLALIGLGVAIDYALLVVTRWREETGNGADNATAVERAMLTAGRSVLFSGLTVAVSLAALIALPVPFLRGVGITGLLIPVISVAAALTLLPALLLVAGPRLAWPHRRKASSDSRLWHRIGATVVRRRWIATGLTLAVLVVLAIPVFGLRLGQPSNASLASTGGAAASAVTQLDHSGVGSGLTQPIEIRTDDPDRVRRAVEHLDGVAGVVAPEQWRRGDTAIVDAWTAADAASPTGRDAAAAIRDAAEGVGAQVGGVPTFNADFISAVYDNAWWVALLIVAITFLLLARALRSIVLPLKALALNVLSIGAAYGITVWIWQRGHGTQLLFDQSAAGSITVWVPIAVFAFLFGLSMDYEVFLLTRIRELHEDGADTDAATVGGVARTGRLVTSAALILFLAFIALSRVPTTDVKIMATGLALGIVIDATIVRGVLAPALVAALGRANWWLPGRRRATAGRGS